MTFRSLAIAFMLLHAALCQASEKAAPRLLNEADSEMIARLALRAFNGNDAVIEGSLSETAGAVRGVYIALRREGDRLSEGFSESSSVQDSIAAAVADAQSKLSPGERPDKIDLTITYDYRPLDLDERSDRAELFANINRGIRGLSLTWNGETETFVPAKDVSANRKNKRWIEVFRKKNKIPQEVKTSELRPVTFGADHYLIPLAPQKNEPRYTWVERGNTFVPESSVTRRNVEEMARMATEWLTANVHDDGRMTYKYWPSTRSESTSNNMIRQWMATLAMVRAARFDEADERWSMIERNIDYNLGAYFDESVGHGSIFFHGKAKLGAAALAALALVEHPFRDKWQTQELALRSTIEGQWRPDGSFRTFIVPEERNDCQNFYPGETLLLWGSLYQESEDQKLLEQFMRSFRYYREWHLENRNPAFIPWHTQANYLVWEVNGDKELADFIFTMNDWLLDVQQTEEDIKYRDTIGRFYDPKRPFGPPHSSSTGVYLEGLIDAFRLARHLGDNERQIRYRDAIILGLRSAMQLQFIDETDMFYIPVEDRDYVTGGFRTTVYNNEIRCDNVQHILMGVLKILEHFEDSDWNH